MIYHLREAAKKVIFLLVYFFQHFFNKVIRITKLMFCVGTTLLIILPEGNGEKSQLNWIVHAVLWGSVFFIIKESYSKFKSLLLRYRRYNDQYLKLLDFSQLFVGDAKHLRVGFCV